MYNIIVKKYGAPENLIYEKADEPKLGKKDIKIDVHYAGLNFADVLTIKGKYQERPRPPFSPGLEVSGVVREVGSLCSRFNINDNVMAIMKYGGFKDKVIVPEENTYKTPHGMSLRDAGAFPVAYGTAFSAIIDKGKIKKNETCLILGATGGVGIAAIQIAKAFGANVIACGGDDNKLETCILNGADFIINYKKNIIRTELKKIGIKEIDLVIDMVGGQSCVDTVKVLAWNGRIIIVGFASGSIPEIPANRLLLKNAKADGLYWGEYAYRYPKKIEEDFLVMQKLYIGKKIKPNIDREFSLKDAAKALNYLIERKNLGKVILKCQS